MRDQKTKTFVYKKVEFMPRDSPIDMSTLLAMTMDAAPTLGQRRQNLGAEAERAEWLVIGDYQGDQNMFFGVLMRYAPGTHAATVLDDPKSRRATVETFAAPDMEGAKREFIDGSMFFGVNGNHLVMMQSTAVRDRTLENHLQWLLHQVKLLPGDHTFSLVNRPTAKAKQLLSGVPVRRIELDGELLNAPRPGLEGKATDVTHVGGSGLSDKVWEALKMLVSESRYAKLDLSELDASKLSYALQLTYNGRRAVTSGSTLDDIGRALRNAEGVNTTILLDNGDKIENDLLHISGKVRVETIDGIPNPSVVFETMRHWLLERIHTEDL